MLTNLLPKIIPVILLLKFLKLIEIEIKKKEKEREREKIKTENA